MPQEFQGRDVSEAIQKACDHFRASQEELAITVLCAGSAGIFGIGRRPATIGAVRRAEERTPAPFAPSLTGPAAAAAPSLPAPATQERIRCLVAELLARLQVEAAVTLAAAPPGILVQIETPEEDYLIGQDGRTLDALQYLVRKMVNRGGERIDLILDVGSFRQLHQDDLAGLARQVAAEVKASGRPQTLRPMSPAERRIVHLTLEGDQAVRSHSIGNGLLKRVVIGLPGQPRQGQSRKRRRNRPAAQSADGEA
ncbi:MAG: R3H domain-containing nucleic acid-binding protein [Thermodesulfobacteriota bacterium]